VIKFSQVYEDEENGFDLIGNKLDQI